MKSTDSVTIQPPTQPNTLANMVKNGIMRQAPTTRGMTNKRTGERFIVFRASISL